MMTNTRARPLARCAGRSAASTTELFAEQNAAAPRGSQLVLFVYNYNYIFWSGDASLRRDAIDYLIYAVVGVGVVLTVLLIQPIAVLLMMVREARHCNLSLENLDMCHTHALAGIQCI